MSAFTGQISNRHTNSLHRNVSRRKGLTRQDKVYLPTAPAPCEGRWTCRVAEITRENLHQQQPCQEREVQQALAGISLYSGHTQLDQGAHASHLSLEGDFSADLLWPSLQQQQSNQDVSTEDARTACQHPLLTEVQRLEQLVARLQATTSVSEKVTLLMSNEHVKAFATSISNKAVMQAMHTLPLPQQYLLLCLPAMKQEHVLITPNQEATESSLVASLTSLAAALERIEQFYDSIGGVLGYQCRSLDLIISNTSELQEMGRRRAAETTTDSSITSSSDLQQQAGEVHVSYHVPQALDLAGEGGREVGARTAAAGLAALPRMAEILPLGGAGDRLGLTCEETGECLPSAMLPYCGRTMLEGMLRDLVAREYLYYRITGEQVTTPVAIMSSEAKGNHRRITQLLDRLNWFGRGSDAFKIFKQPLVPVISVTDGRWLLSGLMKPMTKPGGHGAIWKLMWDEGVFAWLQKQGRTAALIRQISNPMAGMDTTLLALAGCGSTRPGAAFGFMSCDRTIGASEGCNVLQERRVRTADGWKYEYGYTNIEYTEFDRLGISDQPVDGNSRRSVFPANTNVLYVGLEAAAGVVQNAITTRSPEKLMPGLIFNLKKKVAYTDPLTGETAQLHAGRMECTMQNIADYMTDKFEQPLSAAEAGAKDLSTFLVYNMRRKVTSSAKKKRVPGSTKISQTPDGSFYDLQRNAWHLLQQCGLQSLPELGSVEQYLEQGPGFIFLYHPGLGPLWDVISQKISGGSLSQGSEVVLEVAEARLHNVHVDGSFMVHADNVLGHMEAPAGSSSEARLRYSAQCGRVNMSNVRIANAGVDWSAPDNVYWKHQVSRKECVKVLLKGRSEFEAHNVTLTGSHTFEVPDGYRMSLIQDASGGVLIDLTPLATNQPTWQWNYVMGTSGQVQLKYVSNVEPAFNSWQYTSMPHLASFSTVTGSNMSSAATASLPGVTATLSARNSGVLTTPARLRLLQQLSEIDVVLDFTI